MFPFYPYLPAVPSLSHGHITHSSSLYLNLTVSSGIKNLIMLRYIECIVLILSKMTLNRSKTKTLSPVSSLHGHTKAISSAFFSPITGHSVVTVSYDNKIRIFDVTAQEKIMPRRQISHNNQTGRWLTTFKVRIKIVAKF